MQFGVSTGRGRRGLSFSVRMLAHGNRFALWLAPVVALVTMLSGATAMATTDGGRSARVLAFGGPGERYALILEEDMQGRCGEMDCAVYALDLDAKAFKPLWRRDLAASESAETKEDGAVLRDYLAAVPEAAARALAPAVVAGEKRDPIQPAVAPAPSETDTGGPPVWSILGAHVEARLVELWTVESMAAYDAASEDACFPPSDGTACSTCRKVPRWVDGRQITAWACAPKRGHRTLSGEARPCNCHARASMRTLELRERETGRKGYGSKLLVQPYELAQNVMGGPGNEDLAVSIREQHGAFVQARLSRSGVLVVAGAAAHAPMANGTWFPVAAYIRVSERENGKATKPSPTPP